MFSALVLDNREREQAHVFRDLADSTVKIYLLKKYCHFTSVATFLEFHRMLFILLNFPWLRLSYFVFYNELQFPSWDLSYFFLGKNSSNSELTKEEFLRSWSHAVCQEL